MYLIKNTNLKKKNRFKKKKIKNKIFKIKCKKIIFHNQQPPKKKMKCKLSFIIIFLKRTRVGILGGSFDPPTTGHMQVWFNLKKKKKFI